MKVKKVTPGERSWRRDAARARREREQREVAVRDRTLTAKRAELDADQSARVKFVGSCQRPPQPRDPPPYACAVCGSPVEGGACPMAGPEWPHAAA